MPTVVLMILVLPYCSAANAEIVEIPMQNRSFEMGANDAGVPNGWSRYGTKGENLQLKVVAGGVDDSRALLIHDGDSAAEIGVYQDIPVKPAADMTYQATVMVQAM